MTEVYTKIVEISQLDAIYSVTAYGLVDGEKVLVMQESEGKYYVETSDCETGDKLNLDRIDKYGYGGWIPSDNIQIVEEKNYIKEKEE